MLRNQRQQIKVQVRVQVHLRIELKLKLELVVKATQTNETLTAATLLSTQILERHLVLDEKLTRRELGKLRSVKTMRGATLSLAETPGKLRNVACLCLL